MKFKLALNLAKEKELQLCQNGALTSSMNQALCHSYKEMGYTKFKVFYIMLDLNT